MNELANLKEKRAQALANVKAIQAKAKEEKRDLSAEESAKCDEQFAEFDKLGQRMKTLEHQQRLESSEAELREFTRRSDPGRPTDPEVKTSGGNAVRTWFRRGRSGAQLLPDDLDNARRAGVDLTSNELTIAREAVEQRNMTTGAANAGQGLVQYREFFDGYDKALKFYGNVLGLVRQIQTPTGVKMPVPKFDDTNNKGRWIGEVTTVTGTNPTVGSIDLDAYNASSDEIPISIQLLQDSQTAMEMLLPELLGERIGRLLNEAITIGDGVSKPTGIVPSATASGVVAGGSGANPTVTIDNWYDLKYSVDPAYRNAPAATRGFMMHDRYLAAIRKSKDAQGRYFADPFNSGPGTLDGDPIHINADVPTTGVNARIGCYGDYSRYLARQVMAVTFFRLDQIRIRDGVIVFMALARWDGKLLNSSAVKTIAAPAA